MERVIEFSPNNVCSRKMTIVVDENDIVIKCEINGGCQGNTTGLSRLVEGMKVSDVISKLEGITCRGSRNGLTSCPDQLAKGLKNIETK